MNVGALERRIAKVEAVVASSAGPRLPLGASDFLTYAPAHLKIRTKVGKVEPFVLNRAQRFIHEKLEEQKATTGKVRALILKGRQQGCSTYVGGRYYYCTTQSEGFRTFILTHEDAASANLFEMVDRFHDNVGATVKPRTGFANAKELSFPVLGIQGRHGRD